MSSSRTSSTPVPPESKGKRFKDQGNIHFQNGRFEEAVESYTQAIKCDRLNYIFYSNRSMAYIRLHKYNEALADAHRVTLLQPDWVKGFHRMGTAYFELERYRKAAKCFSRALSLTQRNSEQASGTRTLASREGSDSDLLQQRLNEVRKMLEARIQLKWEQLSIRGGPMHAGSFRASACSYGDQVYLFGGVVDGRTPSYLSVFDCRTLKWRRPSGEAKLTDNTPLPPSFGNTCCMVKNKLFICNNLASPMLFDVTTDRWVPLSVKSPTRQRISFSCTLIENKLYLFGGRSFVQLASASNNEIYNDFEVFHTKHLRWETPPVCSGTPPPARHSHTASLCGHKLYIIGGTQQPDTKEPHSLFDVHCLDTHTWTWSQVKFHGECPQGLVYHNALVLRPEGQAHGTKILVLGRRLQVAPTVLYIFDTILSLWYTIPFQGPNPFPRIGLVATIVGSKIWLFGGLHVVASGSNKGQADDGKTKSVLDINELLRIQAPFSSEAEDQAMLAEGEDEGENVEGELDTLGDWPGVDDDLDYQHLFENLLHEEKEKLEKSESNCGSPNRIEGSSVSNSSANHSHTGSPNRGEGGHGRAGDDIEHSPGKEREGAEKSGPTTPDTGKTKRKKKKKKGKK